MTKFPSREGYALILAIMIVFIVMLLIISWVTFIQNRSRRFIHLEDSVQAFYNAESGLAKALWYLAGNGDVNFEVKNGVRARTDTLFGNAGSTANITVKERGFFTEIVSEGKEGRFTETVKARIGCSSQGILANTCNILSPGILHIRGSVEGNLETRGSVDGNVKGEVIQNPSLSFPIISYSVISSGMAQYRSFIENPAQADTELFGPLVVDDNEDIPLKNIIYVNDVVLIENDDYSHPLTIEGSFTIVSPDEIQISGNVRLSGMDFVTYGRILITGDCIVKDAVLYSESEVELRRDAKFAGTILTKGGIKVCENVSILQNSVLLSNTDRSQIELDDRSYINGTIVLCPKVGLGKTVTSQIVVGQNVKVKGLLYSTTGVRLKGTVTGTIFTPTFIGEPMYPDTLNLNVLEGDVAVLNEKDFILPQIFTGMPKKLFSWEKE